jgi:Acyl-CoA dehydrogenase, C-terminal domain
VERARATKYVGPSYLHPVNLPHECRVQIAIECLNEGIFQYLLSLLSTHLPTGRIGIAAQMLGLAQGAFDKSVPFTYQRQQFGQPIGTFQGMAFQIAQAAVDIETARLLTYNAARRKEEGRPFTKEAAMAKYWASVVAQRVSGQAIEWAGGVGFTRETGIEKFWRDSKIVGSCVFCSLYFSLSKEWMLRVPYTKERPISNYRQSPSSSRRNTHSNTRFCNMIIYLYIIWAVSVRHSKYDRRLLFPGCMFPYT